MWFKKGPPIQDTIATWTGKNELTVILGTNCITGDRIKIDIKVADNVDIYPGTAEINNE